jgi:hypothetical protein
MKRLAACLAVASASLLVSSATASAFSYNVYVCGPWNSTTGPLVPATVAHTTYYVFGCGSTAAVMNIEARASTATPIPNGQGASWTATAPPGLSITHIYTVYDSGGNVGVGAGWWGEFFWNGGPGPAGRSAQMNTNTFSTYGCCQASFNNQTVGWFFACAWRHAQRKRISTSVVSTWLWTSLRDHG